jgi:pimeloyl-ACP methyl ester carboxylesterase
MLRISPVIVGLLILSSCHTNWHYIPVAFTDESPPVAPDYGLSDSWAALPFKLDAADEVPIGSIFKDEQENAEVDVFFIHPTTLIERSEEWNASLDDAEVNEFTDLGPMRHQASVFNGSCRVYAPRYRQAHIKSFFHLSEGGFEAVELAYVDVKAAFDYYLTHYNDGRPIIIAGHSQGTTHAVRLLKDYFDGKALQSQLVAAYLVGMPVKKTEFRNISPCEKAADCGCFLSWMTFDKGYYPTFYSADYLSNEIHNPITWSDDSTNYNHPDEHAAILTKNFKLAYKHSISAKPHRGLLWIKKPDVPLLKYFITTKIWHKADYNLFWVDIRKNVALRVANYSRDD